MTQPPSPLQLLPLGPTSYRFYRCCSEHHQSVAFTKTVGEYETFFCESDSNYFFSGINITTTQASNIQITDENGTPLDDNLELTMGVNDFIPAVNDDFFDFEEADIKEYTTPEAIIGYLQNINATVDFEGYVQVISCQ
ncbi:MAG: hypothetical protein AAF798_12480 [Bacteroidota bacterium]